MHKDQLKGKFVTYLDKQSKYRTHKVIKVTGLTLTVKNALGERHRIHPKTTLIFGRQMKHEIIPIEWGIDLKGTRKLVKGKSIKEV